VPRVEVLLALGLRLNQMEKVFPSTLEESADLPDAHIARRSSSAAIQREIGATEEDRKMAAAALREVERGD